VSADLSQSQLPRDPEYWEQLARKVNQDAAGPLSAYAAAENDWYEVLARRAPWLVAASLAAMLILWLTLPPREDARALRWMADALAPNEFAGTLISGTRPPSVEALMVQFPPEPDTGGQQ
jgi:hypothetical protein